MKRDENIDGKKHGFSFLFFFPVFLSLCSTAFSQVISLQDTVPGHFQQINPVNIYSLLSNLTCISAEGTTTLRPPVKDNDRTELFLYSLKTKASKTYITKKLYDLLITSHSHSPEKAISGSSEQNFESFRGRKIRHIDIRRLDVFGTNLNNPAYSNSNKLENLLNKTHINTNENIIKKNLLFEEGDTISPLELSDNERILRELPYIDDARIVVVPVSDNEADVIVFTKDVYSIGANAEFSGLNKGNISVFDKNIFGMGHEFGIDIPYDPHYSDSPGFGVNYMVNNIRKTFINLNINYLDGLGKKTYGFDISRKLVSSETKYAGGISLQEMFTSSDLDSMVRPGSVKYNYQDYWISRSFLINRESVSRIIIGARYTNNNVFEHPYILPDSFHYLQQYKMFLGSAAFSIQKYYKANLIYGYGRTEDIPYGGLVDITFGNEINEFKHRTYLGTFFSMGESFKNLGYFYSSAGISTFFHNGNTEQGMLLLRTNYISNLLYVGKYRMRNFINVDYTRGFDRYSDEYLVFNRENGFSGFRNDSIRGEQRLTVGLESVLFSPLNFYGFRFAFFGFADIGVLFGSNQILRMGDFLSGIGLGLRIRNDNLVFNTLQIRLGFYPNLPEYSKVTYLIISGEQLLHPAGFEPGPPQIMKYR